MTDSMLFLKREWKDVKMISKVDNIVFPDYEDNGMINLGLVFYRESDIIYDEDKDPPGRKVEVARKIAYKAAQEWFHNVFNTSWCSTSVVIPWLHKALVTFMGSYIVDKTLPETRMMDLFVVQIQHEALHLDIDFQSSTSQAAFSEIISYFKVPAILRMLQHAVTEKLFWTSMRSCIYDHEYNFVYPYDYWTALKYDYFSEQEWYGPLVQEKLVTIKKIEQMKTWINYKHYPVINVIREYDQSHFTFEDVTIQLVNITGSLSIPLTYTTQTQFDFDNTSPDIWVFYEDSFFERSGKRYIQKIKNLASNQWIIFNLQQTGYYRVNYDTNNWELISNYLRTENYRNIHVLNRAQIIDDAFHLMLTYQLKPVIFWNIMIYLQKETDYVAWYPMFKALEYMSSIFSDNVGIKPYFVRIIMRNALHEMLKKIGYTEIPNEDEHKKCLRQEAAKWACLLRHEECLKEANNKLMQHFADPKKNTLLPWWKEWTYCNGLSLYEADSIWQGLYNIWVNKTDNNISKFLSCTQNVDIIKDCLNKTANVIKESSPENYILRSQAIDNFLTIITKHVRIDTLRKYIFSNFEEIIPRQISTVATLTVIINHLYDDKQLIELEDFVKNNLRRERLHFEFSIEISSQINKKHEANAILLKIQDKIKKRRSQIEDLHKFLQIFMFDGN
ncbi:aminopeptidase N-like isoform X2 [Formica exsecta]|nr:aminopeptidase N-like isoform X2 [Formica exsecta]